LSHKKQSNFGGSKGAFPGTRGLNVLCVTRKAALKAKPEEHGDGGVVEDPPLGGEIRQRKSQGGGKNHFLTQRDAARYALYGNEVRGQVGKVSYQAGRMGQ
jgi:hypothetical protein